MKNTGLIILGVLILAIIAIAGFFIGTYNKLQVMDENVTANWAQVENQLKRRNDLIPNLVNTVKGYAKHENEIFTNIANAIHEPAVDRHDVSAEHVVLRRERFDRPRVVPSPRTDVDIVLVRHTSVKHEQLHELLQCVVRAAAAPVAERQRRGDGLHVRFVRRVGQLRHLPREALLLALLLERLLRDRDAVLDDRLHRRRAVPCLRNGAEAKDERIVPKVQLRREALADMLDPSQKDPKAGLSFVPDIHLDLSRRTNPRIFEHGANTALGRPALTNPDSVQRDRQHSRIAERERIALQLETLELPDGFTLDEYLVLTYHQVRVHPIPHSAGLRRASLN